MGIAVTYARAQTHFHTQGSLAIFYAAFAFIIFVCSSAFSGFVFLGEPVYPPTANIRLSVYAHPLEIYRHIHSDHYYMHIACVTRLAFPR